MKKNIKATLNKGLTSILNQTLSSSANASSSFYFSQPVEPAELKKFKKIK